MSGPTPKKLGDDDGAAVWADYELEFRLDVAEAYVMRRISAKVNLHNQPHVAPMIASVVREYLARMYELADLQEYAPAKKRHDDLVKALPELMNKIADVIADGNSDKSLALSFDALATAYVDLRNREPDYRQPSREKVTDYLICGLLHLAEQNNLNGSLMVWASGLVDYTSEDAFRKRLERAKNRGAR